MAEGYTDDFHADASGLRSRSSGRIYAPEELAVDALVRFEGDTDPGDESVVFALRSERDGTKGTYTAAYGMYIDPLDAEMIPRLGLEGATSRADSGA